MYSTRIADIGRLNKQRWDAHVATREQQAVLLEPMSTPPTAGVLFNQLNTPTAYMKHHIPETSVVNKVGYLKLFCCADWHLTAAQWIWWTNLVCFLAHTAMVFLTLRMAYWRWDRSMWTDTEHVTVNIFRITQIPTPEMIANNESKWSGWNNRTIGGSNEWYVRENGMPINFATLTLSFFAISACFHLWACVVGLFERYWFIYWRQLDDAFAWWRWLEYSASASVMAMAIAISIGIKEMNTLASIFMLHFTTMSLGFLTEYVSVPKAEKTDDHLALKIISQTEWENEDSVVDRPRQRINNYIRRMVPHVLGYFPMAAAWVILIVHLEWARNDLALITDRTIPEWVDGAIYGTVIIFWSFSGVQIVYQYLPPGYYWGSELIYCVLSLTAKLYLGFFLLINVIMTDGNVEDALAGSKV